MKTYCPKSDEVTREWLVVDAEGKTLGRLAAEVANLLRGKHKPEFTPHVDCGDFVVVVNAEKIQVSGKKETDKFYRRHSGFPGGFKEESLAHLRQRRPIAIIERAVRGMLPHTRLGDQQFTKLKVYAGATHPHAAQKPAQHELPKHVTA
ncbi:MAG: 50S ribosomal protein L13 [Candidatus Melainabacteria bacterium]|uniref:Large ribosomal subunit protein uL13 n=1 Tax=Candidatus Obscuribacter phosphatis TaxID=1906157 RepID=A0A8J7TL49_9BACT|nr:50S ribosomal protein L13 [Candidatus Obscuribacter phosphatis]MCA0313491.1 50S ribosomal protein L13 [Candidatus Melainabacteria bacterium]OPZ86734.1 MAG: 50S ribosomal protein L13 [bacterium ADurb.Bin425]